MQLSIKLQAKDNVLRFCHEKEAEDIHMRQNCTWQGSSTFPIVILFVFFF
jgi:hypothetical protein